MVVASDGYESVDVLIVSSVNSDKEWILESRCTFHMTPNKFSFEDFNQDKEGTVLLGNNESCKEQVVGFVRIKMYN